MQMMQQSVLHGTCAATRVNAPLNVSFVAIGRGVWGMVIAIWCGAQELPGAAINLLPLIL